MEWRDKVALVTGASSGIGLAVAREVVRRGGRVALVARTESTLVQVARELGEGRAAAFPLDVRDGASLAELPRKVVAHFGQLDVLVNNAGANHRGDFLERTPAELEAILTTNLLAPVLLTRAALPLLGRGGVVVNVASLAGKVPVPDEATYCASKAGLRAFSRALDMELEDRGVRVSLVNPGPVDTGFLGDILNVPDLVFSQPMSTAEEVANAVMEVIDSGAMEIDVPVTSGKLATLGYLSPAFFTALRPLLVKRGAKKKAAYLARRKAP
jgi:short-subunit dehydrogenase